MKAPYLPAVITRCARQTAQVDRLVKHCFDLDGTKLTVIDDPDTSSDKSPEQYAANALHLALAKLKGRPFLWLENDSIPLRAGWLAAISAEYKKVGKPFLMPDMTGCDKCDLASGCGVYPKEASWLIPKSFPTNGFDLFVYKTFAPIIHFSKLLQHRYARYFGGQASPWEFPRDRAILSPTAFLFHADKSQSLINCFYE